MALQPFTGQQPLLQPVPNMFSGDGHLLSTALMEQIQSTHAPDSRQVDVKPILSAVEDILNRVASRIDGRQAYVEFVGVTDELASTIHEIYLEIQRKSSGGVDPHVTTLSLFGTLSSYAWDAKAVLALAAFGVRYGELWHWLHPTNRLANWIALVKGLPDILEHKDLLKDLNNIARQTLDITKCITAFNELPTQYINEETPVMIAALPHIPTAVYWTIRSVVACVQQLINLTDLGHESTTEVWELSSLAQKLDSVHGQIRNQLALRHQHIDSEREIAKYSTLVRLFETIHSDNMKILRALIYAHDDILPLYNGLKEKRSNLEKLRGKNILLLISDLDISDDEVYMLGKTKQWTEWPIGQYWGKSIRDQVNRPEGFYDVVWLPVVDRSTPWTEEKRQQFEHLKNRMPWYSVHHPSVVDLAVIKYIKEKWKFAKKPILVVLDPQGRVANQNALHMMWIWGPKAFPFTSMREDALWREETWRLELLVDGLQLFVDRFYPDILDWMREGRLICLYGGEDMKWIRKFTTQARNVSQVTSKAIELVYVGKSNPEESVRRKNEIIAIENHSHTWHGLTRIWFFWVRLESMWYSKTQHGKTIDNDLIMKEILTMLSFDDSGQGWAVISRGSAEMTKAKGETILTSFTEIDQWKEHVEPKGFVPALIDHLNGLHTPHQCDRLILPGTTGSIPDMVVCAECGRVMEKYIMYSCCTEECAQGWSVNY